MPWYVPWSESIKKRACRYLLQRYLGQFLEEKLTLDQLTVDLFNGIGSVRDVKLDVQALNELGEQQNLPVEFVDGYISEICVGIPWTTLLNDSSYVEVTGLSLTIQPKQRADTGVSMFESMWSSMSSSMQIAEECLKSDSEGKDVDQGQPLEGLELFAQTIDTVLSRVKVRFTDTVIRLEHVPKDSGSGVAVEMRIQNLNYFDEAGCDPPIPPSADVHLQQANKVYQVAAVTAKTFQMEGVTFYTDEFPSHARTFSRSAMSVSTSSTPESKHSESGFDVPLVLESLVCEQELCGGDKQGSPQFKYSDCSSEGKKPSLIGNLSVEPDPIIFGKLTGRQELRVQLKQTESGEGPKVNLKLLTGSVTLFLSARQLHVILELVNGLSSPDLEDTSNVAPRLHCVEKPMEEVDYRRVEQELQQQLQPMSVVNTKGLQYTQGWSTASLDDSDDEFLPMQGGMSESVLSGTSSMDASTCSTTSSVSGKNSHRYSTPCASFAQPCNSNRPKKKHHKGYGGMMDMDSCAAAEVTHFHLRVASVAMVLLHEDVLTACSGSDLEGSLARSSVKQMKCVAEEFFKNLGPLAATSFGGADFDAAREVFLKACQLNHIRLLVAPIIIDGSEKSTLQGTCLSGTLMATNMELLECLIDKSPTQEPSVEYVELLKFDVNEHQSYSSDPCVKVRFKFQEKVTQHGHSRKYTQPRRDFNISLQRCCCEIDVSIVDRITALLNPQPMCKRSHKFPPSAKGAAPPQSCFYQAAETSNLPDSKTCLKITSPFVKLKLRFPTPDLRPIHDMDRPPWWKRSVRKDFLTFELTDATFSTLLESHEPCSRYEIQCRDLHGLFQEADTDTSIPFARASADDKNGNSFCEGGEGFGWPRLVIHVFPETSGGELDTAMDQESEDAMKHSSMEPLESSRLYEPSPFSSKRVIHESDTPHSKSSNQTETGEELIIPGDKQEMNEFIEHASQNARLHLEITLPSASVQLASKHLYELIYNRVNTDIFLWEPSAPKPQTTFQADLYGGRGNVETFLQDTMYTAFSMCKSGIQYDSDSDSEDTEGVYYSVCEQRQRQKRRQQDGVSSSGQSNTAVSLSIGQGILSVFAPVRDSGGKVIPGQHGELHIQFDDGNMFSVSGYKGKPGLGYICLQVNQASFYHNGLVATPQDVPPLREIGSAPPSHLEQTIYKSEPGALVTASSSTHTDMLSVAIKIQMDDSLHNLKTFRVAAGLRGATLRHRMCPSQHSWFTQFVDFFDVIDYPISGYDPPGVITELQMHLWDCSVDYRPLHLPVRCMITMGSFSVASNIAAQTSTSTLRFIAEEAALFLSEKTKDCPVNLKRDYVCVMDLGLFELSLRLSNQGGGGSGSPPRVDLRASNNILHIRTCADSGKALADLLTYFASDGDLHPTPAEGSANHSQNNSMSNSEESVLMNVTSDDSISNDLSQSQVAHVHNMMEEAMRETNGFTSHVKKGSSKSSKNKQGVEVFFFPDEATTLNSKTLADSELFQKEDNESEDNWEDDFCILDEEAGSGFLPKNSLPEVRALTPDPVRVIENHFSVPVGKTDLLNAPKHYPSAVLRYTLREMTVVWHMYGGKDFGVPASTVVRKKLPADDYFRSPECKSCPSSPPFSSPRYSPSSGFRGRAAVSFSKSTPSEVHFGYHCPQQRDPRGISPRRRSAPAIQQQAWQALGGPGRQHDVLMELQLNKVRFQHEVYPENTPEASRQVLLVGDVEIRDRLACSQINKFLYQYSSEAQPKQSHANMIVIKAVHIRPDPKLKVQECSLKISLLPLRLNIDQDSLLFLFTFFSDISGRKNLDVEGSLPTPSPRHATPTHQPPVMTVNMDARVSAPIPEPQNLLIMLEDELNSVQSSAPSCQNEKRDNSNCPSSPIFFRSFVFAPDVPIMLDYQGKRVDMTHGPLAGLLMGLGQLNCSELRLKRLSHRHGLLGFDKLVAYVISEWLRDIKKNQLPSLLGGVGPMHALVQLFQGIRDLFWMPIEQYQKDGRIVRGLQRGANSFTTSTAMAALELTNRLVQAIQATAELAFDMLSSGPSVRNKKRGKGKGKRPRYPHPADIREGVANAIQVMTEGLEETAEALMRAASEEHEQKGVSGAVGGVLRELGPRIVVKPIIMTTQATSNLLGGMRSQLVPDVRREAVEKWRVDT